MGEPGPFTGYWQGEWHDDSNGVPRLHGRAYLKWVIKEQTKRIRELELMLNQITKELDEIRRAGL